MAVGSATSSHDVNVVSAPATSSASTSSLSADSFLKLLVTQMQNQDPLNPMDNAAVTSQMAQISTVTGIGTLNKTVQSLSTQFTQMQALQGAALVGHSVVLPGNQLNIDAATATGEGGFQLATPADAVKVEIMAPSGAVVQTMNLGAEASGLHSFAWPAGSASNASGYTFRVTASTGGVTIPSTALMSDIVNAVSTAGNTFNLELQKSGTVPYSTVVALN
ncbi:MAG: flagellar hook assembly protein FlgD [Pseudomonadota bacterium]|nr:flagellar hook assembly protein FlgD [Pseudomonadota bacterium]